MRTTRARAFGLVMACATFIAFTTGCEQSRAEPPRRAQLRPVSANTFVLIPEQGQHPWCLVYTRATSGVTRQLTMTQENKSVPCEPGKPIGGVQFRIPVEEGAVKVHVFFSDRPLDASSIAEQLYERKTNASLHPMDLRLPGNVRLETHEFTPHESE